MNENCEKKLIEEVLAAIEEGNSVEITCNEKCIYVKNTNTSNGNWVSKTINKEDGGSDGFVTNFACF